MSFPQSTSALIRTLEYTVSQDRQQLQAAEHELEKAAESDFGKYFETLSQILADKSNSRVARMAAALQMKNYLTSKETSVKRDYQQRWLSLAKPARQEIKDNVLRALGHEATAAQCVACIAAAELPVDQWPELVPLFISKAQSANQNNKEREATMEAIGFICQEISADVLAKSSNDILQAIIHCLGRDEPIQRVRLAATNALTNSLEFIQHHFDAENERHLIMQVICDATQSADVDVCEAALECLVKMASMYYPYLEYYMKEAIVCITLNAIESEESNVSLQGIEFWTTVAEIELELAVRPLVAGADNGSAEESTGHQSKNYVMNSLDDLVPVLVKKLSKQEEYDDEEDWVPSKAAAVCLMMLSHITPDFGKYVFPTAYNYIKNSNWRMRNAAAMAVGCVVEGLADPLGSDVEPIIPLIWNLTRDQKACVRDTAVWSIGRIIEFLPQFIPSQLEVLVDGLIQRLGDEPRVAFSTCWTFSSLVKAAYETASKEENGDRLETFVLSPFYSLITEKLMETAGRSDSTHNNLRTAAYEVLKIVLSHAPDDCYAAFKKSIQQMIDHLEKTISSREPDEELQSLLCITLPSVVTHLSPNDGPRTCDALMNSLGAVLASCPDLTQSRPVHEDALLAISSAARILGRSFDSHMKVLVPILIQGLRKDADSAISQLCIGLVGDVFRALDSQGAAYLESLMPLLIGVMNRKSDTKAMIELVAALGDIVLAVGPQFESYIKPVAEYLEEMSSTDLEEVDDEDTMRENCLETYANLIESLARNGSHVNLVPYLPHISKLIASVVAAEYRATDGITAAAASLMRHVLVEFGDCTLSEIDVELVSAFLARSAQSSRSQRTRNVCQWAKEQINKTKKKTDEIDR